METVEILLVEDNPNDAELAIRALNKARITNKIYVVRDGAEALEFIFREGRYKELHSIPKLILLDLKLPLVSGLEVLGKIKADDRTRTIPVVILTSSNEDSDLKESYLLGANSYIVKPVDFMNFTKAIRDVGMYWIVLNKPFRL